MLPAPYSSDIILRAMASRIAGVSIVCSTVISGASDAEKIFIWWRHHAICAVHTVPNVQRECSTNGTILTSMFILIYSGRYFYVPGRSNWLVHCSNSNSYWIRSSSFGIFSQRSFSDWSPFVMSVRCSYLIAGENAPRTWYKLSRISTNQYEWNTDKYRYTRIAQEWNRMRHE